jgi:hypothetical protein
MSVSRDFEGSFDPLSAASARFTVRGSADRETQSCGLWSLMKSENSTQNPVTSWGYVCVNLTQGNPCRVFIFHDDLEGCCPGQHASGMLMWTVTRIP